MSPPLHGIRVMEPARVLAGPWCGRLLAGLGADVERTGMSDDMRPRGPPSMPAAAHAGGTDLGAACFHGCSRGQRFIAADVETSGGQALMRRLDHPQAARGTTPCIRSPILIEGLPRASPRPATNLAQHRAEVPADPAWGGAGAGETP